MYYTILFMLSFVGNILPSLLDNYKVVIIPISKSIPSRTNYILPSKKSINHIEKLDKLNIENNAEPTESLKDYFDYSKENGEEKSIEESLSLNREDVIRYLLQRADRESKRFKHSTDAETKILREELEPNFEYDSLYGENKIVGGSEVDINLYPYHAAYGTNCGGAIIDKKWVITAGHCGKKPYVRVGSKYFNQGTKIAVKRNFIHPEWTFQRKEHPFDFDFQLLELAEPMKLGENIQPIKIAHIQDMVIGKNIDVTGWGNTQENGPYSNVLRAVRVPIIAKEHCQHVPFPYFRGELTSRMFCAGFPEGKKDACQGDSGGPAVSSDRLLGMVSFGYGCATPGAYGVYSKVAKVRPWIEQVTSLKLD